MEEKRLDRAFVKKHLPLVYQTALARVGDSAIAKIAVKRVFIKVQEAMTSGNMPADEVLAAWLVFLTQDEAASMMRQAAHFIKRVAEQSVPAPARADAIPVPRVVPPTAYAAPPEPYSTARRTAVAAPNPAPPATPVRATAIPPRQQPRRQAALRDTEVRFHPKKHPLRVFFIILFSLLILVNIWFVYGLLAARGILPKMNFGYAWFDMTFNKLFGL